MLVKRGERMASGKTAPPLTSKHNAAESFQALQRSIRLISPLFLFFLQSSHYKARRSNRSYYALLFLTVGPNLSDFDGSAREDIDSRVGWLRTCFANALKKYITVHLTPMKYIEKPLLHFA